MNEIITLQDARSSLLEIPSLTCDIPISPTDEDIIEKMDNILTKLDGQAIGLAAVQVGYPRTIFLLRNGKDKNGKIYNKAYINPVITSISKNTKKDFEACLSVPGFNIRIARPKNISLMYFDINGELQKETFNGIWARCVMHEMSHLRGKLITHEFAKEIAKIPRKTKCGMKLTPQKIKEQKDKKNKKKRLQKQKRRLRAMGK